jgi:CCR4-NOT transcription complex subunit 3
VFQERFKRCEREHKVTRFSKAGLQRDDTDPAVIAKIQCADWLNDVVTQLETQIEQQEADLEALGPAATGKAKGKSTSANSAAEKAKELSFQIKRHQEYVSKVERVLRLLENDQVTPEEVEHTLKDSLEYFIEAAYEEGAAFIEDEEIWTHLPLDALEENVGKITVHKVPSINLGTSREGSTVLNTVSRGGSTAENGVGGKNNEKMKTKEINEEDEDAGSVAKMIAGVVTSGASAHVTPLKNEYASSLGFSGKAKVPADGVVAATAVTTPKGLGEGSGGGSKSAVSDGTAICTDTDTGTGTGTPASFTTPSPIQYEQQQRTPPPGFMHPVSVVIQQQPQQVQQQQYLHASGPASGSAPGSPFAAAAASDTYLNQVSLQQQQQQQQQQHESSEEGLTKSNDLGLAGEGGGASSGGFRSPFAAKAETAFTPQPSLDALSSSSSSSYFATAATVVAGAAAGAAAAPPPPPLPPPGYYPSHLQGEPGHQQASTPSPEHSFFPPSPLGADWFSFSASWIGEADSQHTGVATAGACSAANTPWLPSRQDVGLLDAGAMQHRPILGDADWRRNDGSFSTSAEDFYFSPTLNGGGGGGLHHPISAIGTRPEWRPPYPTFPPLSYPTTVHPSLKNENIFSKLQLETLFFAFFFHQNSRQQLFAANRLKVQGWRYHKKVRTWFARTMQPEVVTENFEEGVMAYWDPILRAVHSSSSGVETPVVTVSGWNQGTTAPNFRFEYTLLENENTACPSG